LIDPEQLPNEYQNVRTTITANKKAIVAKWRKGIPVKGTRIYRKPKVTYSMLPANAGNYQIMKQATKKNK
jgi:hypothetical protein